MPDIWMDVDTALAEVPVNMMPLIDDTDFKTVEDAIAYDAAGMDLRWNFVTTGGAYTSTAVTPTTSGSYDWTHQGDGMYSIEIPASGGASINNDTEGFGWFSGKITGVLPFRGPVIGFRAAALNDALIDGGSRLEVNATHFGGSAGTFSGGRPEVNATHWGGTAVGSATVAANMVQISGDSAAADNLEAACDGTGYNLGAGSIVAASVTGAVGSVTGSVGSVSAGVTISGSITTLDGLDSTLSSAHGSGSWATATGFSTHSAADVWSVVTRELTSGAAPSVSDIWSHGTRTLTANPGDSAATIADAVWDELLSGHSTAGSAGKALSDAGAAGDPWATSLPGAYSAGTAGYIVGTNLNATVGSRSSHAAADVWSVATRVLTAGTNIVLAKGAGVTGFNDLDAAGVRTAVGLASANLDTQLAAIVADTGELQTDWANGGRLDVILDARASQASVDDLPTNAEFAAALPANFTALGINSSGHVSRVTLADTLTTYTGNTPQTGDSYAVVSSGTHGNAALKTLIDTIDSVVDAILTDTGTDGVVLSSATRDAIAASLLDLAAGVQTNWTLRQALRVILAAAAGKISGADTSTVTIRDPEDTKDRIVASVAASGRTSVTYDKS